MTKLLADRVTRGDADVDAGENVVPVAVDHVDPELERRLQRRADVVGVDDCSQMAEPPGQGESLVPGEQLRFLDVYRRVRKLRDGAHVVEMAMGKDDVADVGRRQSNLAEKTHRRYPVRHAELAREAVLGLHEAGVD